MAFNLEEETIDGYVVSSEIKKLWAAEMDLAQKLFEVCKKYNLRIWADGGTLLGAVRHKGFIPWDDDMDFCMMREDYNKLVEIGPKEFKEPYFFQSIYTDNTWGSMVKIRNNNTAMVDSKYKEWKDRNYGIFIDVFVLDAIPNNKKTFVKEYNTVRKKRKLLTKYGVYKPSYKTARAVLRTLVVKAYFIFHDYYKTQNSIVDLLSSYKLSHNKYCSLIDFYARSNFPLKKVYYREIEWYKDTIELPFCDMMVPAPKDYHELLSCMYGDYLKPVKGGAIHSMICYDCDRSYKEVIAELNKR